MNSKNKKRIIIPIILLVLVIALSMSYAWFVWKTEGNQTVKLTGGSLDLRLDETSSNGINILRAIPQSDSQGLENEAYTFSVINNSDVNASYQLYLDDEELDSSEDVRVAYSNIKYSITRNKTAENPILLSETEERKIDDVIINSGDTNSYTLKLWINSEATKEIAEQIFKGKLRLVATQTDEKFKDIAILKDKTSLINHMSTLTSGVANVTALARANELPSTYENDSYKISTDESEYPAYMWYENNTLYYYSEAERLKLPSDCSNLFSGFSNIESADFSGFDTSQVTEMSSMFIGFASNSKIDSINLTGFNTSNVTDMTAMFTGSGIKNIDLRSLDTSKVENTSYMFAGNSSESINMKGLNLENVTNMNSMFLGSQTVEKINLTGTTTKKVTSLHQMFSGNYKLKSLDLNGFDTSNVTDMYQTFAGCYELENINLSSFNTKKVTTMYQMFSGGNSLKALDLSGFDTSNVTNMDNMINGCFLIEELDLSGFDTSKVTTIVGMFRGDAKLKTIYVSDKWSIEKVKANASSSSDYSDIFQDCPSLVGGMGSTNTLYYDPDYTVGTTYYSPKTDDSAYAHIDEGETNPGLLTLKQ